MRAAILLDEQSYNYHLKGAAWVLELRLCLFATDNKDDEVNEAPGQKKNAAQLANILAGDFKMSLPERNRF